MKTSDLFEKEIGYIKNETIRDIVRDTLNAAPKCIATIPASSSGKYHPKADLGEGGLVRHVRTVTAIAYDLMQSNCFRDIALGTTFTEQFVNEIDEIMSVYQDAALAACILHDCCKPDDSPKHSTVFDHPLKAAKLFKEIAKDYINKDNMEYMKEIIPLIYNSIAAHMGRWNTASYAKGIILPEPRKGIEVFVHLCDYIASRKTIDFNFEEYDK